MNKTSESQRHYLMIEMEDGATAKTLKTTYQSDGIESVKPNNRTKNIYACQFVKDQKSLDELIVRMKKDSKIIAVEIADNKMSPPTNSTNTNSSKAKPGKN